MESIIKVLIFQFIIFFNVLFKALPFCPIIFVYFIQIRHLRKMFSTIKSNFIYKSNNEIKILEMGISTTHLNESNYFV